MSVTIRKGGLRRGPQAVHQCKKPSPEHYVEKTRISCDECGQWWKLKWQGGTYGISGRYYWKKMRRKDRIGDGYMTVINNGPGVIIKQ